MCAWKSHTFVELHDDEGGWGGEEKRNDDNTLGNTPLYTTRCAMTMTRCGDDDDDDDRRSRCGCGDATSLSTAQLPQLPIKKLTENHREIHDEH